MNEREIQSLLALAAKRLHTTPEALRAAAENGDLQNIMGGQNNAAGVESSFFAASGSLKTRFSCEAAALF